MANPSNPDPSQTSRTILERQIRDALWNTYGYYDSTGTFVPGNGAAGGSASSQNSLQQPDIPVGTSSTQVAPAATSLRKVTVTHPGGNNTVFLSVGKTAVVNSGVPLLPFGSWTSDSTMGAVFGIVASGTETVTPFY